jgi:para-aminobenzoate synthetase component 1
MREIQITADRLVSALLDLSEREPVCLLDSCGVSHLGSHLLIAGIKPLETVEITDDNAEKTLAIFNEKLSNPNLAFIFTIAYEFGLKLAKIKPRAKELGSFSEPDVFIAAFDCLVIHDYDTGVTCLTGNEKRFDVVEAILKDQTIVSRFDDKKQHEKIRVTSNFSRRDYLQTIEEIREFIRRGDTYQTNLTQKIHAELSDDQSAQKIFRQLRKSHPAPFAAFIKRDHDYVVSASPERFFKVSSFKSQVSSRILETSPIKGTRPRGKTLQEDLRLKNELTNSDKDRAENTMIVDLLRNDLGRICKFGTIQAEKLCDLETHPTLFHLVSTVRGELRENINFSDIIRAVFPCGSITGAPKISTMRIIDKLETAPRGLSMGAMGYSVQSSKFKVQSSIDTSVAIRTIIIKNKEAAFNVGGGVVIDSVSNDEYEETLVKAKALLRALNAHEKSLL